MMTGAEFHQLELLNRNLERIADAVEVIAKAHTPENEDADGEG